MVKKRNVGAVTEPSAYVEIGGYVHQNEGKATTKLYVGPINQPLKVDTAKLTKEMKKIRVTMNVEEDQSVSDGQVYQKDVWMQQDDISNGNSPATNLRTTASSNSLEPNPVQPDDIAGPSALQVLKNFVDKINDRVSRNELILWGVSLVLAGLTIYAILK